MELSVNHISKQFVCLFVVCVGVIVCQDVRQRVCDRIPDETNANKQSGDNGFRIKIAGRPTPERYTPEQVYTITINGTYHNQKLLGFMLVSVPLNADYSDESTQMGTFQHMNSGSTQYAEPCPWVITHTYEHPKHGVAIIWTAPPAGSGCVEFRATVQEYKDIWYKDDGALTRVFCEETATIEDDTHVELMPECCACGTGKYHLEFKGIWSRQTHPKDYPDPSLKRLLHWSNIVGASHSRGYHIWQYGSYASPAVKQVCEFGYSRALEDEMRKNSNSVRTVIKTSGIWWRDPEGLRQTRWARFSVDKNNHLLSLITMIGPSPDWCAGVSSLNLCMPNCTWAGDMTIDILPWDGGTDDGISYMSPNAKSNPQQKIHKLTNTFPDNHASPWHGQDPIKPLAKLILKRIHPKPGVEQECTDSDEIDPNDPYYRRTEHIDLDTLENDKCAMSQWSDWTACSVTCGVGVEVRRRMYLNPQVDEAMCGKHTVERENCIGIENECDDGYIPEDPDEACSVARWSDWSPCSITCGTGNRQRSRLYIKEKDTKTCDRDMEEAESCTPVSCDDAFALVNFTAVCSLPYETGPCRGRFEKWYYDRGMRKCLPFTYGGCKGNSNKFDTLADCTEKCLIVMNSAAGRATTTEPPPTRPPRQELDTRARCSLPSETGPCRASFSKYYYDTTMEKCLQFTYGGCNGNENRFDTMVECMDTCLQPEVEEPKNKGRGHRDHGEESDKSKDCILSSWTEWSDCSATCGKSFKTRSREVKREPTRGGKKCSKKLHKKKKCKVPKSCRSATNEPTNEECVLGPWGPWSPCLDTCLQERTRPVLQQPQRNGHLCRARLQRRACCGERPDSSRKRRRRLRN